MRDFYDKIYLREMKHQCEFVFIAAEMIDSALKRILEELQPDQSTFWFSIQSFLVASGNISKLLFPRPISKIQKLRGRRIREILAISNDSILKRRTLRNRFEHFDEGLDEWTSTEKSILFIDRIISSRGQLIAKNNGELQKHLREYDPDTSILYYQDDEYNIKEIYLEVKRIYQKINTIVGQGFAPIPPEI